MRYYVQILSTPTRDSFPSILVHFDSARYIFNAGEGLQRICNEHKIKLSKLSQIFFTGSQWSNTGGLPGLLLTLSDAKLKGVGLIGAHNLTHILAGTREFIYRPDFKLECKEVDEPSICFKDENIQVKAIPLSPFSIPKVHATTTQALKSMFESNVQDWTLGQMNRTRYHHLPETSPSTTFMAYLCQAPDKLGALDLAKLKALGVPKGPLYGKLKNGESIQHNGTWIHSKDVVSATKPGTTFIILQVPTLAYIDSVIDNPHLKHLPDCIFHILGPGVLNDERYQAWIQEKQCQHVYLSSDVCPNEITFQKSFNIQEKLNSIVPRVFPKLKYSLIPKQVIKSRAEPLMMVQMEPKFLITYPRVPTDVTPDSIKSPIDATTGATTDSINAPIDTSIDISGPMVIPLGTCSAMPSKYRNVSCTLVKNKNDLIMLDAGEGTMGQFYRLLDKQELFNLKIIFISHLHADHHLGLIRVLLEWNALVNGRHKIALVAPAELMHWIKEYSQAEDLGLEHVDLYTCQDTLHVNGWTINCVPVMHCPSSFAFVIRKDLSIAYSGDCRPSTEFAQVGADVDVLVHEATFDDDKLQEAIDKRHCTIGEAIAISKQMKAKHTLLTHFSQRYAKELAIPEKGVAPAFDLMTLELSEFSNFHQHLEAIQSVYTPEDEDA